MNTVKAYIDLQALRFNIEKIKDTLPKCKIVSVINTFLDINFSYN